MAKLKYVLHGHVKIEDENYIFNGVLPGPHRRLLFLEVNQGYTYEYTDPISGKKALPTDLDIEDLLGRGLFKPLFMAPEKNRAVPSVANDVDVEAILKMDPKAKERQWWTRLYNEQPTRLSDAALEAFMSAHLEDARLEGFGDLPHAATLRRWIRGRGNVESRPLAAMVSMSGRVPRNRNFDPRTEAKISVCLGAYWKRREMRDCDVIDDVQAFVDDHNDADLVGDKLKRPSDETIRQRIRKSETAELYKEKFGDKAFRAKYRVPKDHRLTARAILECGIVDHTRVDTMLVLSAKHRTPLGRPTLVLMIDVAARAILAHYVSFESPSTHTVSHLLKRAVRPKSHLRIRFPKLPDGASIYGLPRTLVYDQALETNGVSHRDALHDLGVEVIYAGAGQPQAKGVVERVFETFNKLLFHRLPGNVSLPASLMREMGYDPADTCVITLEELNELLEEAINVYHYRVHSGIDAIPMRVWAEQAEKGVRTLSDDSVLDKMVGVTKHPCRLDRAGVRVFNLQYCCEKNVPILLNDMAAVERTQRGKRKGSVNVVGKIKYNPDDISRIYFFNSKDNQYYELKCTDKAYAEGTSLWQHNAIKKYARSIDNAFCSPEQRRAARMALRQSIEAAFPEIGLKGKRAHKKMHDAFVADDLDTAPDAEELEDAGVPQIIQSVAADGRRDGGVPQHSPQRGKSARRRNSSKRKGRASRAKPVRPTPALVAMTEELRTAAAAEWRAN